MIQNFLNLLKFIDFFGKKIEFRIEKKTRFKTVIGGVLSLLQLSLSIFLFFSLGNNMINRTDPDVVVSEIFNPHPSQTPIGKNDYFFMFGLQDHTTYQHFYDEGIYTIKLYQRKYYENNVSYDKIVDIPFERCTEDHLPTDLKEYFKKAVYGSVNNLICIKKGYDNGQFEIEGSYDSGYFAHIQIFLSVCKNSTENSICKSQKEIDSHLKSGYFAIYTSDSVIDSRNFKNPAVKQGRDYYIPTTSDVKKGIVRYITSVHIISDEGWLMNDIKNTDHYSFHSDKESFELYDKDFDKEKVLVDYIIRKSTYEKTYTRKYKKIQNVFAEMGGFMNLSFLLLYFFSRPFVEKMYYDSLTNKLYNFQSETIQTKDKNLKNKKLEKLKTILHDNKPKEKEKETTINLQHMKSIDEVFKPKESPLKIGLFQYLCSCFYGKNYEINSKIVQRRIGIQNFLEKMDLGFILKKFLEIEKLKILLLNEDQYHLFEFFPKPIIAKNGKILMNCINPTAKNPTSPKHKSEIISNMNILAKSVVTKKAYYNISKKKSHDFIDVKLMELLDEDIKNVLKSNDFIEDREKNIININNNENKILTSLESECIQSEHTGDLELKIQMYNTIPITK